MIYHYSPAPLLCRKWVSNRSSADEKKKQWSTDYRHCKRALVLRSLCPCVGWFECHILYDASTSYCELVTIVPRLPTLLLALDVKPI